MDPGLQRALRSQLGPTSIAAAQMFLDRARLVSSKFAISMGAQMELDILVAIHVSMPVQLPVIGFFRRRASAKLWSWRLIEARPRETRDFTVPTGSSITRATSW